MRAILRPIVFATLLAITTAWPQGPSGAERSLVPPGQSPAKHDADFAKLFRFEPTGLSLLRPYRRGRIPVVFVHGLWMNPSSWSPMLETLEADPTLRDRYQFWTFGYSTGDPILYSATLLRRDLDEVRRMFDPDGSDAGIRPDGRRRAQHGRPAGEVDGPGHRDRGCGGSSSIEPSTIFAGDPEDRDLFRRALIFKRRREVRRVVFIATPHRGSRVDRGGWNTSASRLVRLPEPLRASYGRLMARNGPAFFKDHFRNGLPTSIDELEWGSSILTGLCELGLAADVKVHSIIADLRDPPGAGGGDGLVSYDSAHLDGVTSELIVSSGHLCQDHPAVIREVRRILAEHGTR